MDFGSRLSRRRLLRGGLAGIIAALLIGCDREQWAERAERARSELHNLGNREDDRGRLQARPELPTGAVPLGLQPLGLGTGRDGLLYVPAAYQPGRPMPFVLLHGAGGTAQHGLAPLLNLPDEAGLILLAAESRGRTWDLLLSDYGPDVAFIDQALTHTIARYAVNPAHLAVGGFSDGASYALSLGLTNGDLFSHVIAFSPGFAAPARHRGQPRIFVSHGTHDQVLPIEVCSRRIVPALRRRGYDVSYREFDGGHTVPVEIAREAVSWFQ
jgi:phospholipase/carboxylesterase